MRRRSSIDSSASRSTRLAPPLRSAETADTMRLQDTGTFASHAVTFSNRDLLIGLAASNQLPSVFGDLVFAESGGLLSYGSDLSANFEGAASYVDLILKGAKPAELPVQLPTKFELVINLKTARALGLTVPARLLVSASNVIE